MKLPALKSKTPGKVGMVFAYIPSLKLIKLPTKFKNLKINNSNKTRSKITNVLI